MKKTLLNIVLLIIPFFGLSQETVILKDSSKIHCKITKMDSLYIYIDLIKNRNKIHTYINKNEVKTYYEDTIYKDTSHYKNGFAINVESLIIRDFKLTYTRRVNDKTYFETMLSYNIPSSINSIEIDRTYYKFYSGLSDPYFSYGRVQVRAGLKKFIKRRFYIAPMLLYSYGHFNKGLVINESAWFFKGYPWPNSDGLNELVTRTKNDIEFLIKTGWTFHKRHFLQDFYIGFGYRYKFLSDEVYANLYYDGDTYLPHPPYPYHTFHSYGALAFHLGYQIGYCK